jgi:ATP adenylyltransferase/5',5'''-P-1,P-4-tetraphosphate phosphorylase II
MINQTTTHVYLDNTKWINYVVHIVRKLHYNKTNEKKTYRLNYLRTIFCEQNREFKLWKKAKTIWGYCWAIMH